MSIPNPPFGLLPNAPMQTHIAAGDRTVMPPWGGWFNQLRQWLFLNTPTLMNNAGVFVSADAIANGAVGDGIHDDTAIVQQTVTATGGILYLRPGKTFLISSTITVSGTVVMIYGGGIISTTSSITMMSVTSATDLWIDNIFFNLGSPATGTCLSISSAPTLSGVIEGCAFFGSGTNPSTGISVTSGASGMRVIGCEFDALNVGVALAGPTLNFVIAGCTFLAVTTAVTTANGSTYFLGACNIPSVPGLTRLYAEYTGTSTALTNNAWNDCPSCTFTINATGTWLILANAYVIANPPGTTPSVNLAFAKNGTRDARFAVQNPISAVGNISISLSLLLSLTNADVIKTQVFPSEGGAAGYTVVGSGSSGMTNVSGIYMGS